MQSTTIKIDPKVLKFALEDRNQDYDSIINKFPLFPRWVNGEIYPTFAQLSALSKTLHFPLGYFFLSNPVAADLTVDFRTIQNKLISTPSSHLKTVLNDMKLIQEWQRDFRIKNGLGKVFFSEPEKIEKKAEPLALQAHTLLNIPQDWFLQVNSPEKAFKYLRHKVESTGITIVLNGKVGNDTHRVLSIEEFRAFALYDEYAPLIFLNNCDSQTGLIFSLLHEFFHILTGTTDIINGSDSFSDENLCNKAAIAFLAPTTYLEKQWYVLNSFSVYEKISKIAGQLKISDIALAYKLLSLRYISETEVAFIKEKQNLVLKYKKKSGGNYWNTKINTFSKHFVESVIADVYAGGTSYTESFKLLGIKNGMQLKRLEREIADA